MKQDIMTLETCVPNGVKDYLQIASLFANIFET